MVALPVCVLLALCPAVRPMTLLPRFDLSPVLGFPFHADDDLQALDSGDDHENNDLPQRLAATVLAALESSQCLERAVCLLGVGEVVAGSYGGRMALALAALFADETSERLLAAVSNVAERRDPTRCEDIPCGAE